MAFLNKINTKAKAFLNSGFGTNSNSYGGRFLNKDGTANVQKRGMGYFITLILIGIVVYFLTLS